MPMAQQCGENVVAPAVVYSLEIVCSAGDEAVCCFGISTLCIEEKLRRN